MEEKSRGKKKKSTISEVNRAKTRMSSYVKCFDADQSTKLGISKRNYSCLCLEPLNKRYFDYANTDENIFYAGFCMSG